MAEKYDTIELAIDANVAILKLNRPDRLNSFTIAMHEEMQSALTPVVLLLIWDTHARPIGIQW